MMLGSAIVFPLGKGTGNTFLEYQCFGPFCPAVPRSTLCVHSPQLDDFITPAARPKVDIKSIFGVTE